MAKAKITTVVSLESTRFNECVKVNPEGSTFLGYLYAELVISGVLGDSDLAIGMPDLQVRLTRDGAPRVDFPADLKQVRGEGKWVARYFSANAETREALTKLVFAIPAVSRAVERALRNAA